VEDAYLYHEIHRTAVEWRICGRRLTAEVMTKVEEQKTHTAGGVASPPGIREFREL